jgi:hypothetical protein
MGCHHDHAPLSRRGFLTGGAAALAGATLLRGAPASALLGGTGGTGLGGLEPFRLAVAWPATPAQRAALTAFDLTHGAREGGVEVLLWPGDQTRLRLTGIRHRVLVDDLVRHDQAVARAASGAPTTATQPGQVADYRTLADYEADMAALVAARPDLCRLVALPEPTLEGRTVTGIEIARDVARPDGRPTFSVDGLHHAREWPSGELSMMFATDLVQGEGTDPRTTALLAACRVLVVPVVNPDGFAHSRGFPIDDRPLEVGLQAVGAGSYWRKNRRALTGDLGLGQLGSLTAYGVDPNRNYGIQWGGPGASDVPVQQDYRGPAVFSEPESRNVNRVLLGRGTTGYLTNHTYSDLVLRPWGDTEADAPDEALLRQLGDACGEINGYASQKSIALYPTTGTSEDHAYAAVGALAYTFEHGLDGFHPPYAEFVPDAYARNREPFMILAEAAADPAHHAVIKGRTVTRAGTGVAADVTIRKTVTIPTADGPWTDTVSFPLRSADDGTFTAHVGPSTSPLSAVEEAWEVATSSRTRRVSVARGETVRLSSMLA